MTKRKIARIFLTVLGLVQILVFSLGGFQEYVGLFAGGMFMFIAATNFCTQCPLFSAIKRLFTRNRIKAISVKKI